MARDYKVFVHFRALESLPKTGKARFEVVRFLEILGEIAHLGGDHTRRDPETGRTFQVSEVAGFMITWWIDAPVHEAKVVDITRC